MPTVVLQKDLFTKRYRKATEAAKLDPSELQIQQAIVARLKLQCRSDILWYHVPNGEAGDLGRAAYERLAPGKLASDLIKQKISVEQARAGAKRNSMGVRKGVADLEFVFAIPHPNLYLELKSRGRGLSPDQKQFRADVRALGHYYEMADTIDEAVRVLKSYRIIPQ
jgi:hypothetical protein